jgi:hypothetical protein
MKWSMKPEDLIPEERELPFARLQMRREHLLAEAERSLGAPKPQRRRWILGALVPAAVLLLAATGITTYVVTRPATHLETVGCFDRADLDANTTIVSAGGRDPVAICAELWSEEVVGPAPAPAELAACVLESGAVGVFPAAGPETCNSLGLPKLASNYAAEVQIVADLRASVVGRFATDCLGESAGRHLVEQELAERGMDGWKVEVAPGENFDAARPCAEFGSDAGRKLAWLFPVEQVQILCYERAELPARFQPVRADGTDPVALCEAAWEQGRSQGGSPAVACLLHGSIAGVFPAGGRLDPSVAPLRAD